jgi:hypothetical protein
MAEGEGFLETLQSVRRCSDLIFPTSLSIGYALARASGIRGSCVIRSIPPFTNLRHARVEKLLPTEERVNRD